MVSEKTIIINEVGICPQAVTNLIKEIQPFECDAYMMYKGNKFNAKSVLSLIGARVVCGDEVEFVCEGKEEKSCLECIISMAEKKFNVK